MRVVLAASIICLLVGCASKPQLLQFDGGQRTSQPGMSFVPPPGAPWSVLVLQTYQITLGRYGKTPNETYAIVTLVYQLPPLDSKEAFLEHVRKRRADEPQTGRFEAVRNIEELDTQRKETCVRHRAASKDYGAKRGGEYTLYETYGMNCIHPSNPQAGVLVELSRKAPPETTDQSFEQSGAGLLQSVQFSDFH